MMGKITSKSKRVLQKNKQTKKKLLTFYDD